MKKILLVLVCVAFSFALCQAQGKENVYRVGDVVVSGIVTKEAIFNTFETSERMKKIIESYFPTQIDVKSTPVIYFESEKNLKYPYYLKEFDKEIDNLRNNDSRSLLIGVAVFYMLTKNTECLDQNGDNIFFVPIKMSEVNWETLCVSLTWNNRNKKWTMKGDFASYIEVMKAGTRFFMFPCNDQVSKL